MRCLKWMLVVLMLCLLPCMALSEAVDADVLAPIAMEPEAQAQVLELYCGPTQGFYRHGEQTLDTGKPYVLFGRYDCWAMVAQGTPEAFGPVGWVEAGAIPEMPEEPSAAFENGFAATVEETAPLTDNPLAAEPFATWDAALAQGDAITILAQLDGWLYVQSEIEDTPVRAFIKADTVY